MAFTVCEFSIICIRRVSLDIYHQAPRHACFNCKCVENNGPDCSPRFAGLSAFLPLCAGNTCLRTRAHSTTRCIFMRAYKYSKQTHAHGCYYTLGGSAHYAVNKLPTCTDFIYAMCLYSHICGRTLVRKFAICDSKRFGSNV